MLKRWKETSPSAELKLLLLNLWASYALVETAFPVCENPRDELTLLLATLGGLRFAPSLFTSSFSVEIYEI